MFHHNLEQKTKNFERKRYSYLFLSASMFLFLISHFSFLISASEAAVSTGEDYSIEFEDINTSLPEPSRPPRIIQKELTASTEPQDVLPPYTITASNDSFAFKISQTILDFGALTATNPVIRTSEISFTTPTYGAQILGYENHPLMNTERLAIPDTTCDTGTCTQSIPSVWENDLTYGFGYRCENADSEVCGHDFSNAKSFKQFSDSSANESPKTITLNQQSKSQTIAKTIYKVNISGTQAIGGYSNTVTYLAIPNF